MEAWLRNVCVVNEEGKVLAARSLPLKGLP